MPFFLVSLYYISIGPLESRFHSRCVFAISCIPRVFADFTSFVPNTDCHIKCFSGRQNFLYLSYILVIRLTKCTLTVMASDSPSPTFPRPQLASCPPSTKTVSESPSTTRNGVPASNHQSLPPLLLTLSALYSTSNLHAETLVSATPKM